MNLPLGYLFVVILHGILIGFSIALGWRIGTAMIDRIFNKRKTRK